MPSNPDEAMNMANDNLTFSQKMQILWETKKMTVIAAIIAIILIIVAIVLLIIFLVVRPFDKHEEPAVHSNHPHSSGHSTPHSGHVAHQAVMMASTGIHHLRSLAH